MIEGLDQGQTQVDCPPGGDMALWAHPIDVHYVCRGLLGWPKLHFQIWSQDVHGRNELRECLPQPGRCPCTCSVLGQQHQHQQEQEQHLAHDARSACRRLRLLPYTYSARHV